MKHLFRFVCLLLVLVLLSGQACATTPEPTVTPATAEDEASSLLGHLFGEGMFFTPEPTATPTPSPSPTPVPTPTPTLKPATVLPGQAQTYSLIIDDRIGLLTDEEEAELALAMEPLTKYGTVAFVTTDGFSSAEDEAMAYSIEHIHHSRAHNSVLLMIDMHPRTIYIFSRGELEKHLTRSVAYDITSNVSHYATEKKYFDCADAAFGLMLEQVNGAYSYSWLRTVGLGILSAALGLLAAYLGHRNANVQHRVLPEEETRRRNITLAMDRLEAGAAKVISIDRKRKVNTSGSSCSSCSSCSSGGSSCSSCSSCGSGGGSSF